MSKVTDGSYGSLGTPVGADSYVAVQASGPAVKIGTHADLRKYTSQNYIPGGRLTLESGVPVSTTDQTAKTTIYYTPFVHNVINLWDGANWAPTEFTETSLALGTLTSAKPYDVFGYLSGGALTLESLAWTNDTTRATSVTLQDGRYCKSGDKTRLLLGSFYTSSTTTTEDTARQRLVGNVYNKEIRGMFYASGAASHSYASGTRRYWNNTSVSRLEAMLPIGGAFDCGITSDLTGTNPRSELCLNDISVVGFLVITKNGTSGTQLSASGSKPAVVGFNFLAANEVGAAGGTYDYLTLTGSVAI